MRNALAHGNSKKALDFSSGTDKQPWFLRKLDDELWEVLSNPAAKVDITAALVHFALIPNEIARQRRRLTADLAETEIKLSF